jgi:hypothetical protein
MKKPLRHFVLSLSIVAVLWCCGCATSVPKAPNVVARISRPPPGKALVNFHRPSSYAKSIGVPVFDVNGKMLADMRDASLFRIVCDPGETVFISWVQFVNWAEHATVIKADLAPDKIYDIMVDVAPAWVSANIVLTPLAKGDPRRAKLAELERQEECALPVKAGSSRVVECEAKNHERIEQIKRDFLGGEKSGRVKVLAKDDCR